MENDRSATRLGQLMVRATTRAADVLGELLHDTVRIKHSRLYQINWRQAPSERLRGGDDFVAVRQTALGAEPLKLWLVVENRQVGRLLDMLMGRHGDSSPADPDRTEPRGARIDPTEADALKETANIVTGACVAVLARELGLRGMSLPSVESRGGSSENRVHWSLPDAQSMCAESHLEARRKPLEMTLLMSVLRPLSVGATGGRANGTSMSADALPGVRRLAARQARN